MNENKQIEKVEDMQVQQAGDLLLQNTETGDIANIISNDEMKEFMELMLKEFDASREESLDMYYIFKDMITNSGDFDSSPVIKEQVASLLKVAQDASNSKMRIFESIMRSKMKQQTIEYADIKQNNIFMTDRRSLLKELEKIMEDEQFAKTIDQVEKIEEEIESIQEEDKKEKNILSKNINNDEESDFEFEIESGDFE